MEEMKETRRNFIVKLLMGGSAFAGLLVSIPVIGALIEPILRKKNEVWRVIAAVDDFKVGETRLVKFENADPLPWSGVTSETAAWLRRSSDNEFIAFSVNCTHLGCPVRYIADAGLFLCPCHGGVYNNDGSLAAGPPPLPLPRYKARIHNNKVEILTSPIPITTLGEETT